MWRASSHLGFRIIVHDGAHDGKMQNKTYKKLQLFKISTGHSPQFTQKEKLTSRMNRRTWHILWRLMAKKTKSTFIYLALIYLTSGWAGLLSLVLHPELQNLWWNVCQLFAEGKKDLCSLSFLIIVPRVLHVCLEKLKYVRSKSITLAGLPFSILCSLLWSVPCAGSWNLQPRPLSGPSVGLLSSSSNPFGQRWPQSESAKLFWKTTTYLLCT